VPDRWGGEPHQELSHLWQFWCDSSFGMIFRRDDNTLEGIVLVQAYIIIVHQLQHTLMASSC